jgi:hypothetical protein
MKFVLSLTLCLLLSGAGAQAATCLRLSQIKSTDSPDGKSLILTMKNGVVWQGQFQRPCSGLRFSGFSWDVRGDQVCEDAQILRVVSTGAICALGKLSLQTTASEKK